MDTTTGTAPTPSVTGAPTFAPEVEAWTDAVRDTEARCVEHAFGAAVASIAILSPGDAAELRRRALGALAPLLGSTDVVGLVAPDELAVLIVPVESITDAHDRVVELDQALARAGLEVAVGWAMRLEGHGLFHAAARADAALRSARKRHGR